MSCVADFVSAWLLPLPCRLTYGRKYECHAEEARQLRGAGAEARLLEGDC